MNTNIPANNYDQAAKELEAIQKGLSQKITKEVKETEKKYFHVALVRSTNNEAAQKYDHRVSIQQLNSRAFEKMEKNLHVSGFDKMIIVHAPEGVENKNTRVVKSSTETEKPQATVNVDTTAETPEQIEARVRKEFEEKYKNHVPATETNTAGTTAETPATDEGSETDNDDDDEKVVMIGSYEPTTSVPNLKKFAEDNKIDLTGLTRKEDILNALDAWVADNVKE